MQMLVSHASEQAMQSYLVFWQGMCFTSATMKASWAAWAAGAMASAAVDSTAAAATYIRKYRVMITILLFTTDHSSSAIQRCVESFMRVF